MAGTLGRLLSGALMTVEGKLGYRASEVSLEDLQDLTDTRVRRQIDTLRQSVLLGGPA